MRRLAGCLGIAILAAALGYSQARDPFVGSWAMDPDKSTFTPGPVPMERYMTFEMSDKGMTHVTKTPSLFGGSSNITYTAKFDGKDYEILGTGLDTVSLKRVDANTIERTGKESGKVSETAVMKVSPDGKTLTITTKGNFRGTEYNSVQIFTRQ